MTDESVRYLIERINKREDDKINWIFLDVTDRADYSWCGFDHSNWTFVVCSLFDCKLPEHVLCERLLLYPELVEIDIGETETVSGCPVKEIFQNKREFRIIRFQYSDESIYDGIRAMEGCDPSYVVVNYNRITDRRRVEKLLSHLGYGILNGSSESCIYVKTR